MIKTFFKPLFEDVKNFTLDVLFPKHCLVCNYEGQLICANCLGKLITDKKQVCINCQRPSILGLTHPKCMSPQSPDALMTFYNYHDPAVAKILVAGKYYFLPEVYEILGKEIAGAITGGSKNFLANAIIVPVPLHSQRQRWRGFNQAEILATTLTRQTGLPIKHLLKRIKPTRVQKDLSQAQRLQNIRDVFQITSPEARGKNVLLVDDVVTTGATLREAVKVLKRNGTAKVICLAVARD